MNNTVGSDPGNVLFRIKTEKAVFLCFIVFQLQSLQAWLFEICAAKIQARKLFLSVTFDLLKKGLTFGYVVGEDS